MGPTDCLCPINTEGVDTGPAGSTLGTEDGEIPCGC